MYVCYDAMHSHKPIRFKSLSYSLSGFRSIYKDRASFASLELLSELRNSAIVVR